MPDVCRRDDDPRFGDSKSGGLGREDNIDIESVVRGSWTSGCANVSPELCGKAHRGCCQRLMLERLREAVQHLDRSRTSEQRQRPPCFVIDDFRQDDPRAVLEKLLQPAQASAMLGTLMRMENQCQGDRSQERPTSSSEEALSRRALGVDDFLEPFPLRALLIGALGEQPFERRQRLSVRCPLSRIAESLAGCIVHVIGGRLVCHMTPILSSRFANVVQRPD